MGQKSRTPPKCYDSSGISGAEQEVEKNYYPECARSHRKMLTGLSGFSSQCEMDLRKQEEGDGKTKPLDDT